MAARDRPSPRGVRSLDELAERLQQLRAWAGSPSYAELARRVNRARGSRPGGHPTSKVTVYDCFRTGRVRLDIELVADLVQALGAGQDADGWRAAYAAIEQGAGAEAVAEVRARIDQPVAGLVGRDRELSEILRSADQVTCLVGMAGVGKTQLALAAAQRLAPGYQRHWQALLRGFDPDLPPASPAAVVGGLLGAAGLSAPRRLGPEEQADLLRREVAAVPTLVVLDNARDRTQLAPLLEALAGARVLVTSRSHLAGDEVPAHELDVRPLSAMESLQMLGTYDEELAQPEHADEALQIAEWCGYLPLQLAIAGARIAERPGWAVSDHRARLESLPPDGQLLGAMETSFAALTPDVRRALRMAALHPGGEMSVAAAAALAGAPVDRFPAAQLLAANLVFPDEGGGLRLHDLVRQHALAESADQDAASQREEALERLGDYYLALVKECVTRIYGPHQATPEESEEAHRQLSAETAAAVATSFALLEQGRLAHVAALALALYPWLASQGRWAEAEALLRAAADDPEPSRRSPAMAQLSRLMMLTGRIDQGIPLAEEAAELDPENWMALNQLAFIRSLTDRRRDAYETYRAASARAAATGDETWHGRIEGNLGAMALDMGLFDEAHEHLARAVEVGLRLGDRHSLFFVHLNLLRDAAESSCWAEFEALLPQVEEESRLVGGRPELATVRLERATWHLECHRRPDEALRTLDLDEDPLSDIPFQLGRIRVLRARALVALADLAAAERELDAAAEVAASIDATELDLDLTLPRAALALARGDASEAHRLFSEAFRVGEELGWIDICAMSLEGLAAVAEVGQDRVAAGRYRARAGTMRHPDGCMLRRDPSLSRGLLTVDP